MPKERANRMRVPLEDVRYLAGHTEEPMLTAREKPMNRVVSNVVVVAGLFFDAERSRGLGPGAADQ
jgi:hypothetical protein